jgi:hypothetical protein
MGWKLKALSFIIALALYSYGGWIFSIPFFLYTFSGLIFRRWRKSSARVVTQTAGIGWKRSRSHSWTKIMGLIFLAFSLAAFTAKGTYSPYVLGFLGLAMLLWGPLSHSSHFGGFRPVADSILLRGTSNPFLWAALAEVKLLTHDVGKALLGVSERIIVFTSERPSIYLSVQTAAFTRNGAQQKILTKLGEVNKTVGPLGGYLLPVDAGKAVSVLGVSIEPVELPVTDLYPFLSAAPYDMLCLETEHGLLKSIGIYRKTGVRQGGRVSIPPSRIIPPGLPLVSEIFRSVGARVKWPNPDEYLAFLTSMFATRFASQGVRVTERAGQSGGQVVVATALSSPPVELTKAQLDAIVTIYAG